MRKIFTLVLMSAKDIGIVRSVEINEATGEKCISELESID